LVKGNNTSELVAEEMAEEIKSAWWKKNKAWFLEGVQ
jgi:hypothetical protein